MATVFTMTRLVALAGALFGATPIAMAQDKGPVTLPDSYRIVMENERMRMIEININPHSKISVDSPIGRERFLYMLTDGALILAPPGKAPYEFALHSGETAVFPAVSPTIENDTDSTVRALMVEMKEAVRPARPAVVASRGKGRHVAKGKARGRVAAKSPSRSKARQAVKPRKVRAVAARSSAPAPLNLRKAASKPARKVTGKGRGNNS